MLQTSEADAGCTTLYLAFLFAGQYVETSTFRLPKLAILTYEAARQGSACYGQPAPPPWEDAQE